MQPTYTAVGLQRMQAILNFIKSFTLSNHYPPTLDEINAGVGLSGRSHVHHYLHILRAGGAIDFNDKQSRTIRLLKEVIE